LTVFSVIPASNSLQSTTHNLYSAKEVIRTQSPSGVLVWTCPNVRVTSAASQPDEACNNDSLSSCLWFANPCCF